MNHDFDRFRFHFFRSIGLFLRILLKYLPKKFSKILGEKGYGILIPEGVQYLYPHFLNKYVLTVDSSYPIEREASTKKAELIPQKIIKHLCRPGDICFDVGANVGTISIALYDAIGPKGKIFAFEPGPYSERFEKNMQINKIENVNLYKLGLSEESGELNWCEDLNNKGNAHLLDNSHGLNFENFNTKLSDKKVKVSTISLDDFIKHDQEIEKVDFIKIDVEGMEINVLRGGREFFKRFHPVLLIETWVKNVDLLGFDYLTEMKEFLEKEGYKFFKYINDRFEPVIYPNFPVDTIAVPNFKESLLDIN